MENKGTVKISQVLKDIFMGRLAAFLLWLEHSLGPWAPIKKGTVALANMAFTEL